MKLRAVLLTLLLVWPAVSSAQRPAPSAQRPAPSAERPAPSADRQATLAAAAAALAAGRTADATRLYAAAAERFDSVEALLQLARLQVRERNVDAALQALGKARMLAPNSEDVLSAIAQVSLGAHTPVPAILILQSLTRICPSVAQHHYLLGVALMQAGDMAGAIDSLQEAQRLEPDRVLTLLALGLSLNNRKRFGDAKPALARALELEPQNVDVVAALAEAEAGLGEIGEAEEHARRALAKVHGNATAHLVIGMVLMTRTDYAAARDALLSAVAADPSSSKALYQLSLAYARLGDQAGAEKYVALYREKLREIDARLEELRTKTGVGMSGMGR